MRIQEVEHKSGLDRATIRYYEKEGMIAPVRHNNGYRDYSQEDLQTLEKVKLLRQLGMSLDQIRTLQQGGGDLQVVIKAQIPKLAELRDHSQRALQVCQLMRDDNATYDTLNAEHYLQQLKAITLQYPQKASLPPATFREVIWRDWHPGRRFFARMTDQLLMVLAIIFVQAFFLKMGLNTIVLYPFNILSYLVIIPLEALCIHFFGATLGKYIFGIHVRSIDGTRLSIGDSFRRSWDVYRYGLGFGIPIWSIYRIYKSYQHYDEFEMDWDYACEVTYPYGKARIITALVTAVLCVSMVAGSIYSISVPPNTKNQLNLYEFSQNYNYFWQKYGNDTEWGLNSDGKFMKLEHNNNVVVIGGKLEFDHFSYEFEGENVRNITYSEEINDFIYYDGCPERAITAATAIWSAWQSAAEENVMAFRRKLQSDIRSALTSGQKEMIHTYDNVKISWSITYEDAVVDGYLKPKETEDSNPYACVKVEISVIEP